MNLSSQLKISLIIFLTFLSFLKVDAATLELNLERGITSTKEDVVVLVTINSEDQDINTAQSVITFPKTLLEVINIDITDSVFSFWLENPSYDNSKGEISFIGGSTSGFNGPALKLMKISFKVKGSGVGQLSVNNGAITISDGTGSNAYTTSKGLNINIPASSEFESVKLERVKQTAILAQKLPSKPNINIPFYPDQAMWSNYSSSFKVNWDVDPGVTDVGISVDKNPNSTPTFKTESFLGNKSFPALSDGIWYLHIRSKNNIGWGPTLHYRLAVDTTPPNSFKITSNEDFKTAEAKPTINFVSSDLTSGIDNYVILLDGVIIATDSSNKYQFSPLLPGIHQLTVRAIDKAGNSTSEMETLEILPIASPTITYVNRSVIVDEGGINAGGTALIDEEVIIQIQNSQKQIVFEQVVPVDTNGNWNIFINKALTLGNYNLLATTRDKNMASSFPVVSEDIKVEQRPVLILGNLKISQAWFFIYLIIILLGSFSFGYFSYYKWRGKVDRRVTIAQRDILNIFDNLNKDTDKLVKNYTSGKMNKSILAEMEYILKDMKNNLEKSRRYIVDNIRDINK